MNLGIPTHPSVHNLSYGDLVAKYIPFFEKLWNTAGVGKGFVTVSYSEALREIGLYEEVKLVYHLQDATQFWKLFGQELPQGFSLSPSGGRDHGNQVTVTYIGAIPTMRS